MTPWTEMAAVISLGVGANTENLPVGLAYGLRKLRIGLIRNLLIAAVTTAATLVPLAVGRGLRGYAPAEAPDIIAGALLVALGLFNTWLERRGYDRQIKALETGESETKFIDHRETLVLASALSINNIGLGFAGGVAGLEYGSVALSVAGFSVALLWMGEWLSQRLARPLGATFKWLRLDGNLLLVAVGIAMMLGA